MKTTDCFSRFVATVLCVVVGVEYIRAQTTYQLQTPFNPALQDTVVFTGNGYHTSEAKSQAAVAFQGRLYYSVDTDGTAAPAKFYCYDPSSGSNTVVLSTTADMFWAARVMLGSLWLSHRDGRLWRSANGVDFTLVGSTPFTSSNWVSAMAEFGGVMYFASAGGKIYSSTNGFSFVEKVTITAGKGIFALTAWNGYLYGANTEDYSYSAKIFRSADGTNWTTLGTFNTYNFYGFVAAPDYLYVGSVENAGGASFAVRGTNDGVNWTRFFYTTSEGKGINGAPSYFSQTGRAYFISGWGTETRLFPAVSGTMENRWVLAHNYSSVVEVGGRLYAIGSPSSTDISHFVVGLLGNYTVVATLPTITTQPSGATVNQGGSAMFTVAASGTTPFTYQWHKDGTAIGGATTASLALSNVQSGNAGSYTVVVANSAGSATSNVATLTVNISPTIITQPQTQSVTEGANVSFSVAASGTTPLSYQWRKDGTAISGATNSTYSLNNLQSSDQASYSVVVSNIAGSVNSNNATLTVTPYVVAPTITAHPQGQSVNAGSSVAFTVAAGGTTPFTYQWRKDGNDIAGATNSTYTLNNVQSANAGIYQVVVRNSVGNATSNQAVLTVTSVTAPTITTHPSSVSVSQTGSATFTVAASGTTPFTYQWRKDGADISGATNSTYSISSAQSTHAGSYSVVVTNSAGSVNSNSATLTVTIDGEPPRITTQPERQTAAIGTNVTLRVAASGTSPFTYQWRLNGAAISGATSDTLTLGLVSAINAGSYTVVVTNAHGSATSNPATLTIILKVEIGDQPKDQSVPVGANVVFTVTASGTPPLTYQWSKDGRAITGATNSTFPLNAVTNADAGSYQVAVKNDASTVQSRVATLIVSPKLKKIINLSVRTSAGIASETLIAGFVVAGQGTAKPVLLRAIGPSLVAFGVTGALADPLLELYRGTIKVAENDNWGDSLDVDQIGQAIAGAGAFPISERSRDAALFARLQPASYSGQVSARAGSGIALIELYDTEVLASPTRLTNVSARSFVGTGAGVLIVGFVIQGNDSMTVLVRGIGPALSAFGVTGVLADPQLSLNKGNEVVASNDEWWRSGGLQALPPVFAAVGAFPLVNGTHDAALVATLVPGAYTVTLSGVDGATGVALIEVYEVP